MPSAGHDAAAHTNIAGKLAVHAREAAQAASIMDAEMLALLDELDEVHVDDCGARFGQRGNAQVGERLHRIVARYKAIAHLLAGAIARLPPPAAMAEHVAAWEAYATRLHGRLEPRHEGLVPSFR